MRKLAVLVFCVLSLSSASNSFSADKPLGVEEFTSVEELANSLSSYFPKVQGEVKAVQDGRLTLALGKKDGLVHGMLLSLWRDGKEILHPVTKAVLGRAEEEVGTIEVTSVGDTSSTAVLKKKLKDPQQGDRARITARKINIALIPIREERPDIIQALADRLNNLGRFNVLDMAKTNAFIKNSRAMDTALVKELGAAFGLNAVISIGLYPAEGRHMVTARIFYTDDASQLDTVVAMLTLDAKAAPDSPKAALGEVKPFFTPQRDLEKEKKVLPELPFIAQLLVTGDLEGDGRQEYAFSDGMRIHIYRDEPSGWREVWTEVIEGKDLLVRQEWEGQSTVAQPGLTIQHINLDAADINGNGRPELFVTALVNGKAVSQVIEFQDGAFRRTADIPGFLRVASYPGKGTILLGMDYDPVKFFTGRPKQFAWAQGAYAPGTEFPLPGGLGLYGWTFAESGERQPLLVAFDDEDRLLVYAGENLLWKSADQYPAVDSYIYLPAVGIDAALHKSSGDDKGRRVRLRPRVLAADVNGDGRNEFIVVKNIASSLGSYIGGFTGATLNGLGWTGARLDPVWTIKDVPGAVYDQGLGQSAQRICLVVKTGGGLLSKDRQQVFSYPVR